MQPLIRSHQFGAINHVSIHLFCAILAFVEYTDKVIPVLKSTRPSYPTPASCSGTMANL